jgi:intracellular multiplication protein IcmC
MANSTCTSGQITCFIADQAQILANLANNLIPVEKLITGSAYVMGIVFAFKAIYSLKALGESRSAMSSNGSLKEPLVYIFVASIFIYFPTAVGVFLKSSFGDSNILQYAPIDSSNSTIDTLFGSGSSVGLPLTILIRSIGLVAFVRGWILIARSASQGSQPGGTGKGIMHVIGGILAINIVGTLEVINRSLFGS